MKVVMPSIAVYFHVPAQMVQDEEREDTFWSKEPEPPKLFLELVGRTCYKSEDNITGTSADKFIEMLNKRGHRAMLEHCVASVKFICDRGVTHELVRHRLASFAQESTRYCNYTKDKFGNQISAILPPFQNEGSEQIWDETLRIIENAYQRLIENGEPPQLARSVLPISVKTEIWCTANLREWQHIFSLRCAKAAHPQIRALMLDALKLFAVEVPPMFRELWEKFRD
jgi:thymidylate synthase (FAD)